MEDKLSLPQQLNYIWVHSKWRIAALVISSISIYFLRPVIPEFIQKQTFTWPSLYTTLIAFGVAIIGLLAFSLLLNILIRGFKLKIDFHPDDYNVSSGITEAVTQPNLRIPFAISSFIINPLGEELFFRMLLLGVLSYYLGAHSYWPLIISVVSYCFLARKTKETMEFIIIAVIGFICSYVYLHYSVWYSFAANGGFVLGIYTTTAVFNYIDSKDSTAQQ